MNRLSLKEKIAQMFIMGFAGTEPDDDIRQAISIGLGGIIFFADNITSISQLAGVAEELQSLARTPLFLSMDQEGGLVERTINCQKKLEYLTPMGLCSTGNIENIRIHTEIMARELKALNINMDFTPVLDVNTNKNNPVIGIRAFSNNPDDIIKYSKPVYEILQGNNIMAVGKHFPGHGEAWVDSHLDMPAIDLTLEELEKTHIRPFKEAINNGLDAIMVAHVNYSAFDKDSKIPASLSRNIIIDYLKKVLNFRGLVISDDMVMGGITRHYDMLDACIKGINAGIDIFIFRNSSNIRLIDDLEKAVQTGKISESRFNESVEKILFYKEKYKISAKNTKIELKIEEEQPRIDKIALESIRIVKKGNLIPLDKTQKIIILSPDKTRIHNYARNQYNLSDFIDVYKEIHYPLNPTGEEMASFNKAVNSADTVIFISYNAVINKGQIELFNSIDKLLIAVASGIPCDTESFSKADSILSTNGYKTPVIKALAQILAMK